MIYNDVLDAQLGQPIGGILFCVLVIGVEDDASSAIDGFLQVTRKCLYATELQMTRAHRDNLCADQLLLNSRKMTVLARLRWIPNE
ncbi:hypothetical protein [Caballeronia sp. ATUFL_M2_KS44]|uniref:hypothetical protein n=1 Tax=Caballeronia sp. ATUFL_M2_KS44 TaxID=2921767 RepID=UPI0020289B01|nr:hypothetical protein [Caballeronia sp. ATUFL_M2_KS44]